MATFIDKLDRIVSGLQDKTSLSNLVPGTKLHQMAQSVAYEGMLLEKQIEDYTSRNSILSATGNDLDNIGSNVFGVQRFPEVKTFITESMKCLKFYVRIGTFGDINRDASGMPADMILPEGTLVTGTSSGLTVTFRISADFTLGASLSELYVSGDLLSGTFDPIPSNTLNTHSFTSYTQSASKMLMVTNPTTIGSGRPVEDDDKYRYRISKTLKTFPRTTYDGIYEAAISVAGVSSVYLAPASNGGGTFSVYIQGITPITGDEIVTTVQSAISDVVPPWVDYNVMKYFSVGLSIGLTLKVSAQDATIVPAAMTELSNYINNFYGSQFFIKDIMGIVTASHRLIYDTKINYVYIYSGDTQRVLSKVDLSISNPVIYLSKIEKLIVEPIVSPILISTLG